MNKRFFIFIAAVVFLSTLSLSVAHAMKDKVGGLGLIVAQVYDPDIEDHTGPLVVIDLLDGTPASKSGIQRGDVIVKIDGEPTKGNTFKYLIMDKLRGEIDSKTNISIERGAVKKPLNFTLTRVEITSHVNQGK